MAAPATTRGRQAGPAAIGRTRERDRYLDLLRALVIVVVVMGYWPLAVVSVEDGRLRAEMLLAAASEDRSGTGLARSDDDDEDDPPDNIAAIR